MNLRQMVVFSILVKDIEGVAPTYFEEKYEQVQKYDAPENLLDNSNREIFDRWCITWGYQLSKEDGFNGNEARMSMAK